jgi:2'-5' RNA ligase
MKIRAFISTDIGAKPELVELEEVLRHSHADLKLVEPDNIHITLKFLGDTSEELVDDIAQAMQKSIEGITPFKLKLSNMGAFPNLNYIKVIWVGMANPEHLTTIAKRLNEELSTSGFKPDKRGFSPHLTLARVKSRRRREELQKILKDYKDHEFGEVEVDCIRVKQSPLTREGPIYTTLKELKLGE